MKTFVYLFIMLAMMIGCKREVVNPETAPLPINNVNIIKIISLEELSVVDRNKNKAVTNVSFQMKLVSLWDGDCYIDIYGIKSDGNRINNNNPIYEQSLILKANDTTTFDFSFSSKIIIDKYNFDNISFLVYARSKNASYGDFDSETIEKYLFENDESDKYMYIDNRSIGYNFGPDINANRCYQPPKSANVSFRINKLLTGKYTLNLYKGSANNNSYVQIGTLANFDIANTDNGIVSKIIAIDTGSIKFTNGDESYYYTKAELISLNGDSLAASFTDAESFAFESINEDTVKYKVNAYSWSNIVDANSDGYAKSAKLKFKIQRSDLLNDTLKIKLEARQYGTETFSTVIDNYEMISINDTIAFDVLGAETLTKNFYDFRITINKYIDEKTYGTSNYSRYPVLIIGPGDNEALDNQLFEKYSEDN